MASHFLPITLRLDKSYCLVVGAGRVALRKIIWLLEARLIVEIVSPDVSASIAKYVQDYPRDVIWHNEEYTSRSLTRYGVVIAATENAAVNQLVAEDANRDGVLVNVASDPSLCTFYVPATVRRGHLQIALSSMGVAPSLLARMREEIEDAYPHYYSHYLDALGRVRDWLHITLPDDEPRRRKILHDLSQREYAEDLSELSEADMFDRLKAMAAEVLDLNIEGL